MNNNYDVTIIYKVLIDAVINAIDDSAHYTMGSEVCRANDLMTFDITRDTICDAIYEATRYD